MTREEILAQIRQHKIVAILRLNDPGQVAPVIDALAAGGIFLIEISMNTPDCLNHIVAQSKREDILLGVGTVTDEATAQQAIDNGARFVVTPISKKAVIETSHRMGVPVLSGAFTPLEVFQAVEWGADMVKLFPADAMGITYFKAIRAPFPKVPFIPTGGITKDNLSDWLDTGAQALGVGSALTNKKAIQLGNYAEIIEIARDFVESLQSWNYQNS